MSRILGSNHVSVIAKMSRWSMAIIACSPDLLLNKLLALNEQQVYDLGWLGSLVEVSSVEIETEFGLGGLLMNTESEDEPKDDPLLMVLELAKGCSAW